MTMMPILFCLSVFCLYYIYDGYLRLLLLAGMFSSMGGRQVGERPDTFLSGREGSELPSLTVLLTVHNEAGEIAERIANLLDTDYPAEKLQILIASDGSEDGTDALVAAMVGERVQFYRSGARLGKTETQNRAMAQATGEIVVFTDAGTRFKRDFLSRIAAPFSMPDVGAVNGQLLFLKDLANCIATSQGYYWNYELRLRQLESRLGILAVVSGACVAIRKSLFQSMNPGVGEDCLLPLDVVMQGCRIVHAHDAIAMDRMDRDSNGEFRARVRMTLRNWQGTWAYPTLLNPLRHPGYALALWSHKILRWLSPFFLLAAVSCALIGAAAGILSMQIALGGVIVFGLAAVIGWIGERRAIRVPGTGTVYSFVLANAGFFVGVVKAIRGTRITGYGRDGHQEDVPAIRLAQDQ